MNTKDRSLSPCEDEDDLAIFLGQAPQDDYLGYNRNATADDTNYND